MSSPHGDFHDEQEGNPRAGLVKAALAGKITNQEGARALRLTVRQFKRLKARFRQVLVVTHDVEIKEQLPNAIEVVKLPGRRATARLVGV